MAAGPAHGAFEPVTVDGPVRWVEMIEDGKHLLLSLSDFDKVAVLDVCSGKEFALLPWADCLQRGRPDCVAKLTCRHFTRCAGARWL